MVVQSSGGGGGGLRPLIDANHIHVWNCDETSGASVLVDSIGGKNLTLQGGEGTAYTLNQTVSGSPYPSVRGLLANNTSGIASNTNMGLLSAQYTSMTWECVFTPDNFTNGYQVFLWSKNNSGTQYSYATLYGNPSNKCYGGVKGSAGIDVYTDPNAEPTLVSGETHHFMFVKTSTGGGDLVTLYIDGVQTGYYGNSIGDITIDVFELLGQGGSSSSAAGYIRDVRISNIARDATYAAAAYAALV